MKKRKFTPKFKTKVVLEALKEQIPLSELAQKYTLHPQLIRNWKKTFLQGAETVFESGKRSAKTEKEQERERLLQTIGTLKVENDFLKKTLR